MPRLSKIAHMGGDGFGVPDPRQDQITGTWLVWRSLGADGDVRDPVRLFADQVIMSRDRIPDCTS